MPVVVVDADELVNAPLPDREGYRVIDVESDDEEDDHDVVAISSSTSWLGYDDVKSSVQDAKKRYHLKGLCGGRRALK